MNIVITPCSALAPTLPAVGIFWRVAGALVIDRSTLAEAEEYGECLTHAGGHYERWMAWQALGPTLRAAAGYPEQIGTSEYDEWPRGRIVYETGPARFILYADRRLQHPGLIAQLKAAFGLDQAEVVVRSDSHYR